MSSSGVGSVRGPLSARRWTRRELACAVYSGWLFWRAEQAEEGSLRHAWPCAAIGGRITSMSHTQPLPLHESADWCCGYCLGIDGCAATANSAAAARRVRRMATHINVTGHRCRQHAGVCRIVPCRGWVGFEAHACCCRQRVTIAILFL